MCNETLFSAKQHIFSLMDKLSGAKHPDTLLFHYLRVTLRPSRISKEIQICDCVQKYILKMSLYLYNLMLMYELK